MMDINELTKRFVSKLNLNEDILSDFNIESCSFDKEVNLCTFKVNKNYLWSYNELLLFHESLLNLDFKCSFIYKYGQKLNNEYLYEFIKDFNLENKYFDLEFNLNLTQDNELSLEILNIDLDINKYSKELKNLFNDIFYLFKNITIYQKEFVEEDELEQLKHNDNIEEDILEFSKEEIYNNKELEYEKVIKIEAEEELIKNLLLMKEEREKFRRSKIGEYIPLVINEIDSDSEFIDINGKIFDCNFISTRKGGFLVKFGISDTKGAIYVIFFANKTNKKEDLSKLHDGMNLRVKGQIQLDNFRKELTIMGKHYYLLPDTPLRDDNSKEKRVELHLHTKMSEMDGVTYFKDYVKLAKHMGHKAIAITDHGNVQGFPDAQEIAKKEDIKVIYGSELYVIDDYLHGSINPNNTKLVNNQSYVCYDTETTGLSIYNDRITEFGAVKIINGLVVDRIDILINPGIIIPKLIEEKTKITNELVKDKPKFEEVADEILDFIKDSVLVSHNIEFDNGMLNAALKRCKKGEIKNPGIDTLALSMYIFPENRSHRLGALCKRYEVDYDEKTAHRANYDAEVLSKVWMAIQRELISTNNDINFNDLANLKIPSALLKHYRRHNQVLALVKNYDGVKELYQIISDSHINHMGVYPFVTKSFLASHRNNLLLGSSSFNGKVFNDALLKSDDDLRESIKFFDFIEIQPLENYSYLINIGDISDNDKLIEILQRIIKIAKEENKLIVATGDCHYLNPEDKVYRDVLINHGLVGKMDHPLNPFYRKDLPFFENPNQHFRSTDEMMNSYPYLPYDEVYKYVVTNSNKIADLIDVIKPVKLDTYTPTIENSEQLLTDLVYKNAHKLYGENIPSLIKDRIDSELNGIIKHGYSVIYYISYLLVKKANDDGYIVGSRGSVGSSLVATLSEITEVNPLPAHYRCPNCKYVEFYTKDKQMSGYDLEEKLCPHCHTKMIGDGQAIPFQTFLGFNADKVPDIDLNFAADYQSRAHEYTKVLLGEKNVFRAGTISAVQFKTAYGYVRDYFEKWLKMDPNKVPSALISSLAYGCVDVKRTTGQHPAGIVVVPNGYDINDFTPIQYPAGDTSVAWQTTHFDFKSIHDTLLKLDILGHVDPQAIKMMCDLTGVNIHNIPVNDKKVLSLFTSDKALNLSHRFMSEDNGALGLPEFGTDFVRQVLRETKPTTFRDLVIISGLTHGTDVWNKNAQDLIKNNITDLRGVIGCRDDIMVYLISQGLDDHNSFVIMETVRKKDKHLSEEQIQMMKEVDVPDYYIDSCEKIQYLFPKGHATAYVMMALRVAYFKVYYPLEYYATYFTLRSDEYDIQSMSQGIEKVYQKLNELNSRRGPNSIKHLSDKEIKIISTLEIALEMYERGYKIENISLKKSHSSNFLINKENNSIIPPFKVIDGIGITNSETLIKAREEKFFTSREDLLKRGGISKTNLNTLEQLGCIDDLKENDKISLFDFSF